MSRPPNKLLRSQLIEGAIQVFIDKGFNQASTRDLAEKTGLSRSHLYTYFADWRELQHAAFIEFAQQELSSVEDILALDDKHDAVLELARCLLPVEQDCSWKLWTDVWNAAQHDAELASLYSGLQQTWTDVMARLLKEGVLHNQFALMDPSRSARQVISLINGYSDLIRLDSHLRDEIWMELLEAMNLLLKPERPFTNTLPVALAGQEN